MLLITNARLIDPASGTDGFRDILIDDGIIAKIGMCGSLKDMAMESISMKAQTMYYQEGESEPDELVEIDAAGMIVAPGLVDPHVHFRDPGFTDKEDIITGAEAAKKGGFTSVIMMGNTNPHMDNTDTVKYALRKGMKTGIRIFTCGNITKNMEGKILTDMEELIDAGNMLAENEYLGKGLVLFSDDGKPITDPEIMEKASRESARLNKVLSLHEEDPAFITDNGINAGEAAGKLGLLGSPRQAEIEMVKRDIEIANKTGAHITIQHISTKEAVEMIRDARKMNRNIHAEATPHHFSLTDSAVDIYGTLAKMNPPLRKEEDRLSIIEGLKDDTIETIATDHAPHTAKEKGGDFSKAPSGIIGLETSLGLGIRELVKPGYMGIMDLISRMTYEPSKIYDLVATSIEKSENKTEIVGYPLGRIYEQGPADLVIFNENEKWKVEDFASKASNSPFKGQELYGKIHYTICRGEIVYKA